MDEAWERAVEAALEIQAESSSSSSPRTLTLDGAVKCRHGRLPPPSLLERFPDLEHLSIANTGVSSLDEFPRLRKLHRLSLSDNRIAAGLDFLVAAGLDSLRDLDLSNNRIHSLADLAPLSGLRLVSLDLYECPVTRVTDYRARVFGMIPSLKFLDKMDVDGNERPESDDDDDEEEDEEDEDEEDVDGEIDGEDRIRKGSGTVGNGDVEEDEESDADEEAAETGRSVRHHSNGFRVAALGDEEEEDDEEEELGEGEEIDEDDDGEEEDVVEVHDDGDSGDEGGGDAVEVDDDDDEVDEDEEDVEDEVELEPGSRGRQVRTPEGEIDGHEQGEDDDDDENAGEIGEADEVGVEEDRDSEDEEV